MSHLTAEFGWPGGDRPGELNFRFNPSPDDGQAVFEALRQELPGLKTEDACLKALTPPDGVVGRYRLGCALGEYFVRISTREGMPRLENAILAHLAAQGAQVNPLLAAGKIFSLNGRTYRLDLRPLIDGRHFNHSEEDLASVAAALRVCHDSLSDFPESAVIRANAVGRSRKLVQARDALTEMIRMDRFGALGTAASWASRHREWLQEMTELFNPELHLLPDAQVLHGEIHPGNVLFLRDSGQAVLLDFEESVHIFAPPSWDLAYLIQRFCLTEGQTAGDIERSIGIVSRHYGQPLPPLAGMMRQAAWTAMAVIADLHISGGVVTPVEEYDKFVRLERQARRLEGVL